ncbi:unnamed protein product [Psylliodes chrysocephalus]|uniref:Mutator-like transposase domain-containing protein n=1 Tax=Psylliodes chrysocephalus TaxID=3402493 RepID=A0A9P0CFY5_9CUCU|nr:unnamed protein product [Psylliodes chrysocephala]
MSTITIKYKMCNIIQELYLENPQKNSSKAKMIDVNSAVTLGTISTGIGFSALEELTAAINMPCVTEKLYNKIYKKTSDIILLASFKVMKEAAKKEAELARNLGEID